MSKTECPITVEYIRDEWEATSEQPYVLWLEQELLRSRKREWILPKKPYDGTNFWEQDYDSHFPIAVNSKMFCTSNYWSESSLYRIVGYEPIVCLINCELDD